MNKKKKMKNAVTYPEATDSERKFNKGTRSNSRYMITLFFVCNQTISRTHPGHGREKIYRIKHKLCVLS